MLNGTHNNVDLSRLGEWMDTEGLERGPIEDARELTGGTQNLLLAFRRGASRFILRRPLPGASSTANERMRREARVLRALMHTDVPHPKLIAACADENVLSAAFYLMEHVDGFNATVSLPELHRNDPQIRRRMGFALVEGAAALGRVDHVSIGLDDFGRPERYLHRQVERWSSVLAGYASFAGWPGETSLPGLPQVAEYLTAHQPASFTPGLIHGDYHIANVLFRTDSAELAAIIDWELATIGDPLIDLGWILATWRDEDDIDIGVLAVEPWEGFPTAAELIEHYARHSRRDLTSINWYVVLACYKLGILLEGTHARACAGRAPRATGERLHVAAVRLFQRALRRCSIPATCS